jgi:hypothetical protein
MIHRYCSPLQLTWKDINFDAYGQSREEQQSKAFTNFRQTIDKQSVQFDTFRIQLQQKLNDIDASLNKMQTGPKQQQQQQQQQSLPEIVIQKSQQNTPAVSRRPSMQVPMEQLSLPQEGLISMAVNNQSVVLEEIARLRELLEETINGQAERVNNTARALPGSVSSAATTTRRSTMVVPSRHQPHLDTHALLPTHTETHMQSYPQDLSERVTDLQLAVNRLHQDVSAIRQVVERMSPLSASLILGRTVGLK